MPRQSVRAARAIAPPRLRAALVRAASSRSKLAFVEALLACEDVGVAAHLGIEWLALHAGVERCLVGLVEIDPHAGRRLTILAAHGVPANGLSAQLLDLDAGAHPLAGALGALRPIGLRSDAIGGARLGLRASRCVAYPLPDRRSLGGAIGLALVDGQRRSECVEWAAGVLGRRLAELRALQATPRDESRLDRERRLLESVIRSVPDPVLVTDPDGRLMLANPRAELYFASDDGTEGSRRAVSLNNMLFSAALSRHALEGSDVARRELPLVDPSDGETRLFELMCAPLKTPEGNAVVSVLRNVNDLQLAAQENEENYRRLRMAEAEVLAERDRLDLIIDSVVDPIIVTDASGGIIMTNAPAERLFTAQGEAPNEELLRVRANDARFSSHVAHLFFLEPGGRFRGELGLVDPKTGAPVPVEAISGKVLSAHGEVTAIVTILHDHTEQMEKNALYEELKKATSRLEEKVRDATAELVRQNELLQRQAIELEAASSAKSMFLANMSHEFRTPLNAILGYSSMLLQGVSGPLSPATTRHLTRIDSNGRHLLTIIDDILDIARIEAGKMPLNVARFSAADLVKEVLGELEPLIARSKLDVSSTVGQGVPFLRTDRAKVKQILMNLLSNALKFTPGGSVIVAVEVVKRRGAQSQVAIAVADTGIGIDDRDQSTVFQDFRQVDNSPTRPYGGTGLGLAICRRLAGVLGGEIRLVSKIGEGSTFTLILPAKRANAARPSGARGL